MKKFNYLLTAAVLLLAAACNPKQKEDLVITVKNLDTNMAIIEVQSISDTNDGFVDTIYMNKGKFVFNYPQQKTYETLITFLKNGEAVKYGNRTAGTDILYFPGEKVKMEVELTSENRLITRFAGSQIYEGFQNFSHDHEADYAKSDSLMMIVLDPSYKGDKAALQQQVMSIRRGIQADRENFIKENPKNEFSGYLLYSINMDDFDKYYQMVDPSVKEGKLKEFLEVLKKRNEDQAKTEKARENTVSGKTAFDFTLKNIDGKDFTLSSLRGKYVVLDFWGSWCGYCIQGIPNMKSLYEKYRGELEIVGVDCGEPESAWKKAVKEYALPWINVYNGENGVDAEYGVSAYPTKVVIGPDGKIIEVFEGETPEFYVSVEKIMGLNKK